MRIDRELLELAAKAAGIRGQYMQRLTGDGIAIPGCVVHLWNPLTDDGDALRLAVGLRLDLSFVDNLVEVCWYEQGTGYTRYKSEQIDDAQGEREATRRVIVRAAAEIGTQAHPDNKDGGAVYG